MSLPSCASAISSLTPAIDSGAPHSSTFKWAAGAQIAIEPRDTEYGSREYAAQDCEGYWWSFGTYHP